MRCHRLAPRKTGFLAGFPSTRVEAPAPMEKTGLSFPGAALAIVSPMGSHSPLRNFLRSSGVGLGRGTIFGF